MEADDDLEVFESIASFRGAFPGAVSEEEGNELSRRVSSYVESEISNTFGFSCDDPDDFRGVAERIESLGGDFDVDTGYACAELNDAADEKEAEIEETRDWEPDDEDWGRSAGSGDSFSDGEMESMFRTLE